MSSSGLMQDAAAGDGDMYRTLIMDWVGDDVNTRMDKGWI